MKHSKNYEKVKSYYIKNLWDDTRVSNAVLKKWITKTEYKEITGKAYTG